MADLQRAPTHLPQNPESTLSNSFTFLPIYWSKMSLQEKRKRFDYVEKDMDFFMKNHSRRQTWQAEKYFVFYLKKAVGKGQLRSIYLVSIHRFPFLFQTNKVAVWMIVAHVFMENGNRTAVAKNCKRQWNAKKSAIAYVTFSKIWFLTKSSFINSNTNVLYATFILCPSGKSKHA